MQYTAEGKGIYDSMGFVFLITSFAMEYHWKSLELCGEGAPGMAAAFAIAISLGLGLTRTSRAGHIVLSPAKMSTAAYPNPNHTVAMR